MREKKFQMKQLEHFLDFIMSPEIMTDAPFGECTYKKNIDGLRMYPQ